MRMGTLLTAAFLAFASLAPLAQETAHGAGATFPYPLYARWAHDYRARTGRSFNYQSLGSGAGLLQIRRGVVDFGASEIPLEKEELERAGLVQFPLVVGVVVVVANLPGQSGAPLRVSPEVLAGLFLGRIERWDDHRLQALNPGRKLPPLRVGPIVRADGSGTTWLFTRYLSAKSPAWAQGPGAGAAVKWPCGAAAKGNEGVASYVKEIPGAVGYVEYAYAMGRGFTLLSLERVPGEFVEAGPESVSRALQKALAEPGSSLEVDLLDVKAPGAWPLTGLSYILLKADQRDRRKGRALLDFFHWCLAEGAPQARELGYFPLPPEMAAQVEARWGEKIRCRGERLWP
ncbi:MAG: phosphate ABC transporter substrate-binding protein PstS [Acidobacteriota bacterium]